MYIFEYVLKNFRYLILHNVEKTDEENKTYIGNQKYKNRIENIYKESIIYMNQEVKFVYRKVTKVRILKILEYICFKV